MFDDDEIIIFEEVFEEVEETEEETEETEMDFSPEEIQYLISLSEGRAE